MTQYLFKSTVSAFTFISILTQITVQAQTAVNLNQTVKQFTSPNNLTESCVAFAKLPLAKYKNKDVEEEARLCNLDFYAKDIALCPKTWSTSPGTIIQNIVNDKVQIAKSVSEAEATLCKNGTPLKSEAKFKQTMNQPDTSGTYSGSSLLYYHFSRALDTTVNVPVAVYRTMDAQAHYQRVTSKARPAASAKMNSAGWSWIKKAESSPKTYNATSDFFMRDLSQIYGVVLKDSGQRYGIEINGTRKSGWGNGQNFDFQKTPAFLALKTKGDLLSAITNGYNNAIKDPLMKSAFNSGVPSNEQMVLWMNEVSEIAILDYMLSQQDRIGNIDYKWMWLYKDNQGNVKSEKVDDETLKDLPRSSMAKIKAPKSIESFKPILVQKTFIGDNDAGGIQYANFTKKTGMLDGVAGVTNPLLHINRHTYNRVLKLAKDLKNKGDNYNTIKKEFSLVNLNEKRLASIVDNTISAAQILEKNCHSGILKLDLVSIEEAMNGHYTVDSAKASNCSIQD